MSALVVKGPAATTMLTPAAPAQPTQTLIRLGLPFQPHQAAQMSGCHQQASCRKGHPVQACTTIRKSSCMLQAELQPSSTSTAGLCGLQTAGRAARGSSYCALSWHCSDRGVNCHSACTAPLCQYSSVIACVCASSCRVCSRQALASPPEFQIQKNESVCQHYSQMRLHCSAR